MVDDPKKQKLNRKLMAAGEEYEVQAFAEKYDLPTSEATQIIKRVGHSRKKLDDYMASLK